LKNFRKDKTNPRILKRIESRISGFFPKGSGTKNSLGNRSFPLIKGIQRINGMSKGFVHKARNFDFSAIRQHWQCDVNDMKMLCGSPSFQIKSNE
jgi:hypothetical protein